MRVAVCLAILASAASAQNGSQLKDWAPSNEKLSSPAVACPDLRSLTGYGFTVITAIALEATAEAPAHCRVNGQILPEIRFEVNLPARWNGRLYMFGNGGYAGESFEAGGRVTTRARALRHGFAVAATNTGHDGAAEPLGSFAVNSQKLYDYAFRSLHTTAETAKKLVRAYYGVAHSHAYFDGCSTGGRQALILAQRFPGDFDGIVVGAPVLNFSGTMVAYVQTARAMAAAPVPTPKLKLLADAIYSRCDAKDGLQDGVIDDPRRCDFSPSRDLPKCGDSDGPNCFTSQQIGTLEKVYEDVMSQGKRIFPGWPVGAEIAGSNGRSGWDPWLVREGGSTISATFAQTFFAHMAFPQKDPQYNLSTFDFDKDPPRLEWIHNVLDATDPDLKRFRDRGGKMVMYYGWADPALNARMGVEYYEKVRETMGPGTGEFFRLFMVPGMFHCGGGVGTSTFDALTPVIQWVEQGRAPDRIQAASMQDGKANRTRPLCPHPQTAVYNGSGSIDEAQNFVCRAPY